MKDTIFLICSSKKIERTRKTLPKDITAGRIPVKAEVTIPDDQFGPTVIEKEVYVDDFREDLDLKDVDFQEDAITEEEAEMIKEKRKERAKEFLEEQGFEVKEGKE